MNKVWACIERLIRIVITPIFKLIRKEWTETQWESFFQFVKFGLVGVSNTVISYVTYVAFIYIGAIYLVANTVAFVVSVLNSYYWNERYVFTKDEGEKRSPLLTLIKTFIAYGATGLLLSSALLILWIEILHVSPLIAPIINLIVTIPLNFIINKLWAYRVSEKEN